MQVSRREFLGSATSLAMAAPAPQDFSALRADFPLAQAVRDLLEDGIAVDLTLMSPPKEV